MSLIYCGVEVDVDIRWLKGAAQAYVEGWYGTLPGRGWDGAGAREIREVGAEARWRGG